MVKKRQRELDTVAAAAENQSNGHGEDSGSDEDMDIVNVDFEWFNFKPDIDFHGVKSLLRQLFDVDSTLFDLSALTDLILSQPTVGSTVKVDGEETDAYAFLTILNMHEHREKKVMQDLAEYLLAKSKESELLPRLTELLNTGKQVGLLLAERMINVPAEISPPMYTMLMDEIEAAVEDKEPYEFTHYLIVSKEYEEIASMLDEEEAPRTKKSKGKANRERFYFHPEDEVLQKHASASATFDYTKDEGEGMADSKRAFSDMGIKPRGSLILIEATKFEAAVKAMTEFLSPPQ